MFYLDRENLSKILHFLIFVKDLDFEIDYLRNMFYCRIIFWTQYSKKISLSYKYRSFTLQEVTNKKIICI